MLIEGEGLNKQEGSASTGKAIGSSLLKRLQRDVFGGNEASETIDRIDRQHPGLTSTLKGKFSLSSPSNLKHVLAFL